MAICRNQTGLLFEKNNLKFLPYLRIHKKVKFNKELNINYFPKEYKKKTWTIWFTILKIYNLDFKNKQKSAYSKTKQSITVKKFKMGGKLILYPKGFICLIDKELLEIDKENDQQLYFKNGQRTSKVITPKNATKKFLKHMKNCSNHL